MIQAQPRQQPVCLLQSAWAVPLDAVPDGRAAPCAFGKEMNEMKQEVMAGAVLCAMGLALLFISPNAW